MSILVFSWSKYKYTISWVIFKKNWTTSKN